MDGIKLTKVNKIDWTNKEAVKQYMKNYYIKKHPIREVKEPKYDWSDKKSTMTEYNKEYYKANKEKIYSKMEHLREKTTCQLCGKTFAIGSKVSHERSQIHQLAVKLSDGKIL